MTHNDIIDTIGKREIKFRVWDAYGERFIDGDWSISAVTGKARGRYGEEIDDLVITQ